MNAQELIDTGRTLVAGDKDLIAMDESSPTCNKRLSGLEISQTEEAHVLAAQQALYHGARCNRAARRGEIQCRDGKDMSMTTSIP